MWIAQAKTFVIEIIQAETFLAFLISLWVLISENQKDSFVIEFTQLY